jgi:predicted MFS family arabinose efflux permease
LLWTLAGVQFTHILDFMIMMPLGPQFIALFGISNAEFGLLVSSYTLAAGASGLLATTYIDRFGRKRLLVTLYGLFGLATLACGLAPDYASLLAARGVLSALTQTIVADAIPFERRGRAMGVVMSSFSVSTVAGVPLGLWLAAHWNWHVPFVGIAAMVGVLAVLAAWTMPRLDAHVHHPDRTSVWRGIGQVLSEPAHWRAFAFTSGMMFTGFMVIPYITIYLQFNAGVLPHQVPWMYLLGGLGTLVSARWIGRLSDRLGKVWVFQRLALAVTVPLVLTTVSAGWPLWALFSISSALFVVMSGRMIPGMALVASTAEPRLRGTFLSMNASVQSASMGVAALISGLLVGRDAQGQLTGYWLVGLLGVLASLLTWWLAPRLRLVASPGSAQ